MKKPELISPAGDLEKLKIALMYGADAVYASTPKFSMRTREIGFDMTSLKEGIKFAHSIGKKVYLTVNVFPHPLEIDAIKKHVLDTIKLKPDAIIVADPGVVEFIKSKTDIPIHLSTQANVTNQLAANFWHQQGISRIVLARELSLKEIKKISDSIAIPTAVEGSYKKISPTIRQSSWGRNDKSVDLESFVHGAMCMAYSGRCQISNYMTGRDPNRGACIQACRFKYKTYGLEEEFHPGEVFEMFEDDRGSYVLNSKDLCMIEHVPELIDAGVTSFKIEGRLKSIYYVGIVTRAYRKAIDQYFADPKKHKREAGLLKKELEKSSNRGFTTGFYLNKPDKNTNNYSSSKAKSEYGYIGLVRKYDPETKTATIDVKNQLKLGSDLEFITPGNIYKYKLTKMLYGGEEVDVTHADHTIEVSFPNYLPENSFVRLKLEKNR